jgi:hypothetical protein
MSGEVSYFSRFFAKFVEIIGAGLASAVCAYMLAHFGGLLSSSPTPASAPALTAIQLGPTPSEPAKSQPVQPPAPVAAAAVDAQRPPPQQDADAPVAQPSVRSVKEVKMLPPRKRTKTESGAEKKPPSHKSAEALARAALANVDANRSEPIDVQPRQADVPTRGADVRSRRVGAPSRDAAIEAAPHAANVQPQLVQPRTVDIQPGPLAGVDALPPSAGPPLENAAPQPTHPADRDNGVFFALKRMRSDPPAPPGEAPRPPMPVGTPPP